MSLSVRLRAIETGVAIIGCAPAVADAVLPGCSLQETGIQVPRRILTYLTHREHEADIRLSSPSRSDPLVVLSGFWARQGDLNTN